MRGIYQIRCLYTGKCYIGSSEQIGNRWRQHLKALESNTHVNAKLQNAWNKYGKDQFEFTVLLEVTDGTDLLAYEQLYLDGQHPTFNIAEKAGKPPSAVGRIRSAAWKAQVQQTKKERYGTGYTDVHTGVVRSEETCVNISKGQQTRYANYTEAQRQTIRANQSKAAHLREAKKHGLTLEDYLARKVK